MTQKEQLICKVSNKMGMDSDESVFPSDSSARIVLEQNKFSKKLPLIRIASSSRGSSAHFLCLQSHTFTTELSYQVLIEGYLTQLLFVCQLAFLAEINRI